MKKLVVLLLLALPILLFAQDGAEATDGFSMGGAISTVTINDETYTSIRLMPELAIWKFGIGLDVDLLIDGEGNIREEDWDDWEDYVNKFYYLRFAQRTDPFYFKIGGIRGYTLGNGLIMDNYSNMLHYPNIKQIGLYTGFNAYSIANLGGEVFTSNITENDILGARVRLNPFYYTAIPWLDNLMVAASVATDINQYNAILDTDGDKVPDQFDAFPGEKEYAADTDDDGKPDQIDEDSDGDGRYDFDEDFYNDYWQNYVNSTFDWDTYLAILNQAGVYEEFADTINPEKLGENDATVVGLDYELPLFPMNVDWSNPPVFYIAHYAEYAKIIDYGDGIIFPGFKFIWNISENIFKLTSNLEYRIFNDEFVPGYFDALYDDQRARIKTVGDSLAIVLKEDTLKDVAASNGWYGKIRLDLFQFLYGSVAYQHMTADKNVNDFDAYQSIWANAGVNLDIIPVVKDASIGYSQTNVDKIRHIQDENAYIYGQVKAQVAPNTDLVGKYQVYWNDLNQDGVIKGAEETTESYTIGVEFRF
ncbi:MAG: hypothetical protein JXR56_04860 [Candidatus Cloacimonetes bacterium]|nr:hypothetical protein [Candidatus Cloacimonadota bacterium]